MELHELPGGPSSSRIGFQKEIRRTFDDVWAGWYDPAGMENIDVRQPVRLPPHYFQLGDLALDMIV
ncbi:hypothetical protein GR212_06730 [Rhizobium lusitanum]|uniref:Uncharacterized protein n=1 Tax=Rhizobium lusitanum TaxID=293958 RepID=A0A6L9U599_9HYPH|nr:hypothetical protein [Rhizobium lusitanum]NEI69267.1 hypothetical protein [Rhizobium lusitanum]